MTSIQGLRGLILQSTALEQSVEFYQQLWQLELIESWTGEGVFFRASGDEPFVLGLLPGPQRKLLTVRYALESPAAVEQAYDRLKGRGITPLNSPAELALPGNYYGFHITDCDGSVLELSATTADAPPGPTTQFVPERLSHLVINSPDNVALRDFYINELQFKLADWYRGDLLFFMRCNQQHHCLGLEKGDNSSLNHVAFQVADLDAMMRNVGRMTNAGYQPLWGPGRHGPGGNCFCYFEDPNGYVVEFTSELINIPDGEEWTPKEWIPGPDNANVWGTGGRSERAIKLMAGH